MSVRQKRKESYNMSGRWNVGDKVSYTPEGDHLAALKQVGGNTATVVRLIIEKRETGYTWVYPERPDHEFDSENSNDEFMEAGWVLASCPSTVTVGSST
jgi:hypothetical protein